MLRRFFGADGQQGTTVDDSEPVTEPRSAIQSKPKTATRSRPVYSRRRRKRSIPWYGWLIIIIVMLLGFSALGLFAFQTWEFVSWLFPNESFGYRILAVMNFDLFSTVWLCLHLFIVLQPGAKAASIIAGGIDLFLSILCTVVQFIRQAAEQLQGAFHPDPNLIATGMIIVVVALLVNFISSMVLLYAQWPFITGQAYEDEEEEAYSPAPQVYSPPVDTSQLLITLLTNQLQLQSGGSQAGTTPLSKRKVKVEEE